VDVLKKITLSVLTLITLSGCQIGYLVTSASSQVELLMSRRPIEEVLNDPTISEDDKRKLKLAVEAKEYSQSQLGLKKNKNYSSYVKLNRPFVSYVVSASPKNELKHYLWKYPMVGELPYKGFPKKESADREAEKLKKDGLDVHVRGVSAYSTLGWFNDPVLSSMLRYKDHDLVNTIIHENVHATLYIKSEADFNERLAAFVGNIGTQYFYEHVKRNISNFKTNLARNRR
jgi:predicted aminopeptidase